jgi:hypothetical protein
MFNWLPRAASVMDLRWTIGFGAAAFVIFYRLSWPAYLRCSPRMPRLDVGPFSDEKCERLNLASAVSLERSVCLPKDWPKPPTPERRFC